MYGGCGGCVLGGLSEAYRCRSFPGGFCVFAGALVCPPCGGF
ncbi:hypothetical protein MOTT12_00602 [Mycobacterium intracellulare subsp. yongonense]|nr:hypothetical protein MOTT12_00602 [Mycobacterium intracellulare subsp. yongonense]ARR81418.1 hypothetical protein MOTT27_00597 [Mycobacterium intracellulare subsp. yongonense]